VHGEPLHTPMHTDASLLGSSEQAGHLRRNPAHTKLTRAAGTTQSDPTDPAAPSSSSHDPWANRDVAGVFGGSSGLTADVKHSLRFWTEHHADAAIPQVRGV
jgi:hypothetical protein